MNQLNIQRTQIATINQIKLMYWIITLENTRFQVGYYVPNLEVEKKKAPKLGLFSYLDIEDLEQCL